METRTPPNNNNDVAGRRPVTNDALSPPARQPSVWSRTDPSQLEQLRKERESQGDAGTMDKETLTEDAWHLKYANMAANYIAQPEFTENCAFRGIQSVVIGGGMGFCFGTFFSSLGGPLYAPGMPEPVGWKAQTVEGFKQMGRSGVSSAKGFAVIGGAYATSECLIEKFRGRSDIWNAAYAGCASGGLLAIRSGPTGTLLGCAGMTAFSLGIEYFFMGYN
eukprot:TRINITY_DN5668_c0_g1_i3.p1 TRINITY_DN5668_c0_g1~~TRINITY_DN5668_c0_g1_i3.p1  ORF type:complete len:220 (+),score=19.33 TRINITY_DN5668_c0_g1_i3:28-687(+)